MTSRAPKRPRTPAKSPSQPAPAFDPIPMFDLDAYCTEHPPSVKRIRVMQEAAQAEAMDVAVPLAARRHNLTRMKRWLDTLLGQLDPTHHGGDDHDHPNPRNAPGEPPGGRSPQEER
jgi:hypothetical protein